MAAGHGRRGRGGEIAIPTQRLQPRKVRRHPHAVLPGVAPHVELATRIGMEDARMRVAAGVARSPHIPMPWWSPHVVAATRAGAHPFPGHHRGLLRHHDRFLTARSPAREEGGSADDHDGDDKTRQRHGSVLQRSGAGPVPGTKWRIGHSRQPRERRRKEVRLCGLPGPGHAGRSRKPYTMSLCRERPVITSKAMASRKTPAISLDTGGDEPLALTPRAGSLIADCRGPDGVAGQAADDLVAAAIIDETHAPPLP